MALRQAALWGLLAAKLWGGWGVTWDIRWHLLIGRDSFWIPPHLMTYSAVAAAVLLSLGILGRETLLAAAGHPAPGTVRVLGLVGSRGMHLAWWGILVTVLAAPIDDLWHRLFGLDLTLWSPPHLLGILGSQVNSAGCLLLALETYPFGSRSRFFALLLGGALFFGMFHLLLRTSIIWAYDHGGLAFFYYPVLGALLLPVALVPVARLTALRWTPVLAVAVAVLIDLAGGGGAKAGFEILKPMPAIEEAIAQDPSSPVAKWHQIARENGTPVVTYTANARYIAGVLLPTLALSLLDPRRRAVPGSLAFAATYLAIIAWSLAQLPAFQSRLPTPSETVAGVILALTAGAIGGRIGHRLASALEAPLATLPREHKAEEAPRILPHLRQPSGRIRG